MIPATIPLCALAVLLPVWFALRFKMEIGRVLSKFRCVWFVAASIAAMLYAGTKPAAKLWRFNFQNYVTDNGSYCTNDTIHAIWNYSEAYASYTFRWAYRDLTITNEVGLCVDSYHYLPDYSVSDGNAVAIVENATNMEVTCYAQYVAPVHVVTNGTYHVSGVMRTLATTNTADPVYVTPGVKIFAKGDDGISREITPTNEPPQVSGALNVIYTEEE